MFALDRLDRPWSEEIRRSLPGRFLGFLSKHCRPIKSTVTSRIGSALQWASFVVVLVLMASLGLPQFAGDKEGLALMVVLALGLRGIGSLLGGRDSFSARAMDALVLAYFGAHVIAAFSSHYLLPSLKGLAKVVVYIGAYFLFRSVILPGRYRGYAVVASLLLAGTVVSLYGLYQFKIGVAPLATWEDPSVDTKTTRIYSTLGNPNLLAGYLIPLFPLSLASSLSLICRRIWLVALPALAAAAVILAAIALTGSRGAYLALFAEMALFLLLSAAWAWRDQPKLRPLLLVALIAAPAAAAAAVHFVPGMEQRVLSIFQGREHSSNAFRMNVWQASLNMFLDNWWFGIGPGNQTFTLAYGLYMRSGFDALGTYCVPLEVAVECGVLGIIAFAALILAMFASAHISFWTTRDGALRWMYAGLIIAIAGLMVHGLFDTVFYRPQVQLIFWMLVALIVSWKAPDRS